MTINHKYFSVLCTLKMISKDVQRMFVEETFVLIINLTIGYKVFTDISIFDELIIRKVKLYIGKYINEYSLLTLHLAIYKCQDGS